MRDSHSHANESQPMCMTCSWDCLDIFHRLQGQFLWRPRTDQATWVVMHCRGLIPTRFVGSFGLRLSAIFSYHITSSDQRFRWVLSVASTSKKVSRLFQLTKASSWFRCMIDSYWIILEHLHVCSWFSGPVYLGFTLCPTALQEGTNTNLQVPTVFGVFQLAVNENLYNSQ